MAGIGAGFTALNIGAKLVGAKAVLARVPRWAWIALAVVVAVAGLTIWHQHAAHKALKQADAAGYSRAVTEMQKQLDDAREAARQWKLKADTANNKITSEEKARHDETVAHNRALADALRVRLGTKAQSFGGGGAALSGASSAPGRAGGPHAQAHAGLAGEADTVCVPGSPLIDYAEQADNDHDALIRIEDAWRRFQQNWPKPKARP